MKKYIDTGKKDTRSGFGAGLLEAGRADERVVALTADLKGSLKMDEFAAEFPERFIQCGIAEANMIGAAAGLAISGKIPFAGSFAEEEVAEVAVHREKVVLQTAGHVDPRQFGSGLGGFHILDLRVLV